MTQENYFPPTYPTYPPVPAILSCPSCQHLDNVRKVSSIVSAGTTHSHSEGSSGGLSFNGYTGTSYQVGVSSSNGVSMSGIAQNLRPPVAPKYPTGLLTSAVLLLIVGFVFISISPGLSIVLVGIGALCGFLYFNQAQTIKTKKMPAYHRALAKW